MPPSTRDKDSLSRMLIKDSHFSACGRANLCFFCGRLLGWRVRERETERDRESERERERERQRERETERERRGFDLRSELWLRLHKNL
jgi:hypothetical protein